MDTTIKEKFEKDMFIRVQPSLHEQFSKVCNKNYKTVSEAIRELMLRYIKEDK